MEHPTTPNSPIDLDRDIRELLETISKGRETLRSSEARDIFEAWRVADENWRLACDQLTELVGSSPSLSREEIALKNEAKEVLGKQHVKSWHKVQELRSFVDRFGVRIEVFLTRLPNQAAWKHFPELIRSLSFRASDSWIQADTDLDTLEMRLGEMRGLLLHPGTDAGVNRARPLEEARLTPRLQKIQEVILELGQNVFQEQTDSGIIRESFRAVKKALNAPSLTKDAFRAAVKRIRKARGYPSSAEIRKRRRTN